MISPWSLWTEGARIDDTAGNFPSPHPGAWTGDGMTGLSVPDPAGYPMLTQPNLQRSSQLPGAVPVPSYPATGASKASLELVGDLNNMAKGW